MCPLEVKPHPLFADVESATKTIGGYSASHPCVFNFLGNFPAEFGVMNDFHWGRRFLVRHIGAFSTYAMYRTSVERLLLWSWIFSNKPALALNRTEFEAFISFCKEPPPDWIGTAVLTRFLESDRGCFYNEEWRPFIDRSQSVSGSYTPPTSALRQIRSICSSFYNFLHAEGAATVNPVVAVKSQNARSKKSGHPTLRTFSSDILSSIMQNLESRSSGDPADERALFIVAATVYMCLRATDLANSDGYCPTMDCFVFENGTWWLILTPPGKSLHTTLITPEFLPYLQRYQKYRGLLPPPEKNAGVPILETAHGRPGLGERQIRIIVQEALKQVHADVYIAGVDSYKWNALLTSGLSRLRDSGAKHSTQTLTPVELQKNLRNASLAYTYGRYYRDYSDSITMLDTRSLKVRCKKSEGGSGNTVIDLPPDLLDSLGLKDGDFLTIEASNGVILLRPVMSDSAIR
jgi:hypothetical protein